MAATPKRRRWPWRPLLGGLALILAVAAVVVAVVSRQQIVRPPELDQELTSELITVERGELLETVEVNGALEPREQARVSFREGVRVVEVLVERGDLVIPGQILARLETRNLELRVAGAQAELDQAEQSFTRLAAGPSQADLAQAAAAVARARANLAADAQAVRLIDRELAEARLTTARQRLLDLEAGVPTDDLTAAERAVTSAEEALVTARQNLVETRDRASRSKISAEQNLEQGLRSHERVQLLFSDMFWDWDFVQRTGRHPTDEVTNQVTGLPENRELTPREIEDFRRRFIDAENSLAVSEQGLANLVDAAEQARVAEVREIQTAERGIEAAERSLNEARRSYELARTRGLPAAVLEARKELADAEKAYTELTNNPDRPARRAELEAALLEAIAREEKLRAGADPVELARARTAIEQAHASLATAEADLAAATLTAPLGGTIVSMGLQEGTLTTVNSVIRIVDLSSFLIRGQVTEQGVARVATGQDVQVRVDSVPGESFPGKVLLVSALPASQSGDDTGGFGMGSSLGGLYPVELELVSADPRLRVGMAVTASIEILAISDALIIPLQAVEYGESGPMVRRATGGSDPNGEPLTELVPVELGAISNDQVQVLSGLNEGDQLVILTMPPPMMF
ncbi:MAG: efflux RND transporter periplasmic adaptor subunit [Oscillochloridaceae bacterium umkhey_bin13]